MQTNQGQRQDESRVNHLLPRLRLRLGPQAQTGDDLLASLLLESEGAILAYTRLKAIPRNLEYVVIRLAAFYYSTLGVEGATRYTEGAMTYAYDGLPKDIQQVLEAHRVVRAL